MDMDTQCNAFTEVLASKILADDGLNVAAIPDATLLELFSDSIAQLPDGAVKTELQSSTLFGKEFVRLLRKDATLDTQEESNIAASVSTEGWKKCYTQLGEEPRSAKRFKLAPILSSQSCCQQQFRGELDRICFMATKDQNSHWTSKDAWKTLQGIMGRMFATTNPYWVHLLELFLSEVAPLLDADVQALDIYKQVLISCNLRKLRYGCFAAATGETYEDYIAAILSMYIEITDSVQNENYMIQSALSLALQILGSSYESLLDVVLQCQLDWKSASDPGSVLILKTLQKRIPVQLSCRELVKLILCARQAAPNKHSSKICSLIRSRPFPGDLSPFIRDVNPRLGQKYMVHGRQEVRSSFVSRLCSCEDSEVDTWLDAMTTAKLEQNATALETIQENDVPEEEMFVIDTEGDGDVIVDEEITEDSNTRNVDVSTEEHVESTDLNKDNSGNEAEQENEKELDGEQQDEQEQQQDTVVSRSTKASSRMKTPKKHQVAQTPLRKSQRKRKKAATLGEEFVML